jgi:hypothetical protein
MMDELLSPKQVAQILRVVPKTLKKLAIPAVQITDGKRPRYGYTPQAVEQYVKSHLRSSAEAYVPEQAPRKTFGRNNRTVK